MNSINFSCRTFKKLSKIELYRILQLRAEVFVVEQNCPYQDLDEFDFEALHICGYRREELIAYSRILKPGTKYLGSSIGRIVTKRPIRNSGVGKLLIQKSIEQCIVRWQEHNIFISAQKRLKNFYMNLGFEVISESYLEDGIPHIEMLLKTNLIK